MKVNLSELKARIKRASYQGYKIAYAESYAADLGGGAPPEGVEKYSPEHLLHLIKMVERGVPAVKAAPTEVAPIKAAPIEPTPTEPSVIAEPVELAVEEPTSETKSKKAKKKAKEDKDG